MWKKSGKFFTGKEMVIDDLRVGISWKLPGDKNLLYSVYCDDKRVTRNANILKEVFQLFFTIFNHFEYKLSQKEYQACFYQ